MTFITDDLLLGQDHVPLTLTTGKLCEERQNSNLPHQMVFHCVKYTYGIPVYHTICP